MFSKAIGKWWRSACGLGLAYWLASSAATPGDVVREPAQASPANVAAAGESASALADRGPRAAARVKVDPGQLRWSFDTGGAVLSSPAIGDDGTVFVGSASGKVAAVDPQSGLAKWVFQAAGQVHGAPALGHTGILYAVSLGRRVYGLDAKTGAARWEVSLDGPISSSPAISLDETVYVGADNGRVFHALDGATGRTRWAFLVEERAPSLWDVARTNSAAIGEDGTVYVPTWAGKIVALDGASGRRKWQTDGRQTLNSPILGADGTVYAGFDWIGDSASSMENLAGIAALDAASGAQRGLFVLPSATACATPVLRGSGVLFVGMNSAVHALSATVLTQKWVFSSGGTVRSTPALASDNTVYVGSTDGRLYALNGLTGGLKWSFVTGGPVHSSPNLGADGTVYVGSADGRLYAIAGSTPLAAGSWPSLRAGRENRASRQTVGPPQFVASPLDRWAVVGRPLTLSVSVTGTWPRQFQWYRAGQPIPGATESSYSIPVFGRTLEGEYYVEVVNSLGKARSAPFRLLAGFALDTSVSGPGAVAREPDQEVYSPGTRVTLTAVPASGNVARPFLGWEGPTTGVSAQASVVVEQNTQVVAKFAYLPGEVKWQANLETPLSPLPAIGHDGIVYAQCPRGPASVASDIGKDLLAFNPADRTVRWTRPANTSWNANRPPWEAVTFSPAVGADETVYVGGYDGHYYLFQAFVAQDGDCRWAVPLDTCLVRSLIGGDGRLFLTTLTNRTEDWDTTWPGTIEARSPEKGESVWRRVLDRSAIASVLLDGQGHLYAGTAEGRFFKLEEQTGEVVWESPVWGVDGAYPAVGPEGFVYVARNWSRLAALNPNTGEAVWQVDGVGGAGAPVVGPDGTVYAAGGATLKALDGATGALRWSFQAGPEGLTAPVVGADNTIYVATRDLRVYALSGGDGSVRWTYDLNSAATPPDASGGTGPAVVQSRTDDFLALGSDGALYVPVTLWESESTGGRAYGRLYSLQASTGLADSGWPRALGDAQNTGRAPRVGAHVRIVEQPRGVAVADGQTPTLRVQATGDGSLGYQWYRGLSGDTSIPIAGATAADFTTPPVSITSAYWVRVRSGAHHADSLTAFVTVGAATRPPVMGVTCPQPGVLRLEIGGSSGARWRIEQSEDLAVWTAEGESVSVEAEPTFRTLPLPSTGRRFFRLVQAP